MGYTWGNLPETMATKDHGRGVGMDGVIHLLYGRLERFLLGVTTFPRYAPGGRRAVPKISDLIRNEGMLYDHPERGDAV